MCKGHVATTARVCPIGHIHGLGVLTHVVAPLPRCQRVAHGHGAHRIVGNNGVKVENIIAHVENYLHQFGFSANGSHGASTHACSCFVHLPPPT